MPRHSQLPATLQERAAFLHALFHGAEYHSSYIHEKVQFALSPGMTADYLYGALDAGNQERYDEILGVEVR